MWVYCRLLMYIPCFVDLLVSILWLEFSLIVGKNPKPWLRLAPPDNLKLIRFGSCILMTVFGYSCWALILLTVLFFVHNSIKCLRLFHSESATISGFVRYTIILMLLFVCAHILNATRNAMQTKFKIEDP